MGAHHQYPNQPLLDPDLSHFRRDTGVLEGELGWRCHKADPHLMKYTSWRRAMLYVPFWTTFGISMFHDLTFFLKRNLYGALSLPKMSPLRRAQHIAGRFLVMLFGVYIPFFCIGIGSIYTPFMESAMTMRAVATAIIKAITFAAVPWGIHGMIYFVFSQISHINEECFKKQSGVSGEEVEEEMSGDWATYQVSSTWDYSVASAIVGTLANGLNNQIVHHLCPLIHPCHFAALAPIVAAVATKQGIDIKPRQSDLLVDALRRTWQWL